MRDILSVICVVVLCSLASDVVANETETIVITAEVNTTLVINCTLFESSADIKWYKDSTELETVDKKLTVDNMNLTLVKVGEDYCGEYWCSNGTANQTFNVLVHPWVKQYEKPKNVIEGDPFQLECNAWGNPPVTVSWQRGTGDEHVPIVVDDERIVLKNSSTLVNATLRIKQTEYDDAGFYYCIVENEIGNNSARIEIRVKDKLAALWPFLGICGEVIILCAIIFIYEKRRNKRLEEEENNAEEVEHMNAAPDTKGSDDVRQRK